MKTIFSFMSFLVIVCFLFSSCENKTDDIDAQAIKIVNSLKPPVRLLAKDKTFGCWGVVLIDGNNRITSLGDMTSVANRFGASYKVGDTIIKVQKWN